jgi:hypothetical protein
LTKIRVGIRVSVSFFRSSSVSDRGRTISKNYGSLRQYTPLSSNSTIFPIYCPTRCLFPSGTALLRKMATLIADEGRKKLLAN